ncbi:MAG TPA: TRAP transporter substrate-binding protein DctP [Firmicutes bacterium]|nr:TRAP transporter substrate-binding protein DctP [Bacillota bacterium]
MQRKRLFYVGICLLLVLSLALSGCGNGGGNGGGGDDEKVYEFSYQLSHGRQQYLTQQAHLTFAAALEEKSGGRLKPVVYDTDAVSDDPLGALASGTLQMAQGFPSGFPGVYPLTDASLQPFLVPSSTVGSLVMWEISQEFPEWREEYPDGVKVLSHFCSATYQLHSKDPIKTLEDLKGKKVGAWDSTSVRLVEALGGIPINDTGSDSAMNLDRGLIDAVLCPLAPVIPFGIAEIAQYHTITNFYVCTFFLGVNEAWFNSLPEDLQQIILDEAGEKFAEKSGLALDEGALIDCERMYEMYENTVIYDLPNEDPEEYARWVEKVSGLTDTYLADMDAIGKGEVAREILAAIEKKVEEKVAAGVFIPDYSSVVKE